MLRSLHISNYALIDTIDIDFDEGLNVITGETGAGKSIILGALSLILGGRADSRVVTDTSRKSVIEAEFQIEGRPDIRQICLTNGIEPADGSPDRLVMRREISPQGRSRAFVGASPVTLNVMRELAMHLVDIHSQHRNLLLADPAFQLEIIDTLAEARELRAGFFAQYNQFRESLKRLRRYKAAVERSRADEEFIRYQIAQLDRLNPARGELESLEKQRESQERGVTIKRRLTEALQALREGPQNISTMLVETTASIEDIEDHDTQLPELSSRLSSLVIEVDDIASTLADIDSRLDADAESLQTIDERIDDIRDMMRRFKTENADDLITLREQYQSKLDILDGADATIARLEKEAKRALQLARQTATGLSERRRAGATALGEMLTRRAMSLGMKNISCLIAVEPAELTATGADKVEFLFAFNKNQTPASVAAAASGGEISRLMLSLKAIIAERMKLPSLILDEIDTGVSGDVASRMGALMHQIAADTQVIAITHLPQVAARAAAHFKVYKSDDSAATHTHIKRLTPDERIDHIAEIMSGSSASPGARAAAIEMLNKG